MRSHVLCLVGIVFAASCAAAPEADRLRQGRQRNGVNRQNGDAAAAESGGSGFLQHLASLLRDQQQQNYSDVSFNSRLAQAFQVGLRIVQTQAQALTHLMRALAPLDTLLADQNWRSAQTASMRQESASTFNMILDLVLRFVRVMMTVLSDGNRLLASS